MARILACFLALGMLLNSGCAVNRATASVAPGSDLDQSKSYYVVKFGPDGRGIHELIAKRLNEMGYKARAGLEPDRPADADIVVTYQDKWMWDITMYMIELTITMRDPNSDFPLATGNSMHTSLTRKSPEEMVNEVLTNIFEKNNALATE